MKHQLRFIIAATLALLTVVTYAQGTARAQSVGTESRSASNPVLDAARPCLRYTDHVYEVCTAYVANASLAVLVPYYKYANSSNESASRYVGYRLGSRYIDGANRVMTNRVSGWPSGTYEVAIPSIEISSVQSSLATGTATLVTRETWRVATQSGRIIYREDNVRHVVTMKRVPSYILHKWVVSDIKQ